MDMSSWEKSMGQTLDTLERTVLLTCLGKPLHLLVRKRSLVRGIISRKWTDEIIMSPETPYLGKISWFYFLHYRHLAFIIAQFQNDDNFVLGIKD